MCTTTDVEVGPRCPARNLHYHGDTGAQCVREEGHYAPHVGADGSEWLVALRCRIGAETNGGIPICERIEGHDGACVARPLGPLPPPVPARRMRPLGKRGVCGCGKARQEHEGETHTGGVPGTDCRRYRP